MMIIYHPAEISKYQYIKGEREPTATTSSLPRECQSRSQVNILKATLSSFQDSRECNHIKVH